MVVFDDFRPFSDHILPLFNRYLTIFLRKNTAIHISLFCSNPDQMEKVLEFETEDTTMFIVMDSSLLTSILSKIQSPNYFAANSWLTVIENKENEANEKYLQNLMAPYKNIQLNSRLYFLAVNASSTENFQNELLEVYRIPTNVTGEISVNLIARFKNGDWVNKDTRFIWDRRKNLKGHTLISYVVQSKPFVFFENNVRTKNIGTIIKTNSRNLNVSDLARNVYRFARRFIIRFEF